MTTIEEEIQLAQWQADRMEKELGALVWQDSYAAPVIRVYLGFESRSEHWVGVGNTTDEALLDAIGMWNAYPNREQVIFEILARKANVL